MMVAMILKQKHISFWNFDDDSGAWFILVASIPLIGLYIWLQIFFRKTNIEIQRLESLSR